METKTRVIIADAGEEYRMLMSDILAAEGDFEVAGCTGDGLTAYSLVLKEKPDVLLTDLILSGLDGLAVLEKLSSLPDAERPAIIIISVSQASTRWPKPRISGASYFMQKPCDIGPLVANTNGIGNRAAGGGMAVAAKPCGRSRASN